MNGWVKLSDTIGIREAPSRAVLVVFKHEFGHCDVPYEYEGNPSLVSWCKTREEHTHTKNGINQIEYSHKAISNGWRQV